MPELILPTTRLHAAFLECRDNWGPGLHEDGFGLDAEDDVDSPGGFATWVHERVHLSHPVGEPCPGLERVLLPCLADNVASARTIERNGGVLESILDTEHGRMRRYWIDLDGRHR